MHVTKIPDIIPMDRWDGNYAHMLMRREQVLIKLRENERNNFLKGAQPQSTTDASDKSKGASNTTTAPTNSNDDSKSKMTKSKTYENTKKTDVDQSQQRESSDDDDEDVTEMENVD